MPDGHVSPPLLQTAPLDYLRDGGITGVEAHEVLVENGRFRQHQFTLDRHGFALIDAPSRVADLRDEATLRRDYYPEVEAILRAHLGASRVVVCEYGIGNAALRDLVDARRYAIVKLWRPLRPVQENPLALLEWPSIEEEDVVPASLLRSEGVGEAIGLRHNPRHAWVYFPNQLPNEALVIKLYDSATDGRARLSFHRAFEDPSSPPDALPREGIEVRALVFWE